MLRKHLLLLLVLVMACGDSGANAQPPADTPLSFPTIGEQVQIPPLPALDTASVAVGQVLYAAHCATCHGVDLRGDPNWQIPNEDGSYLPPPQDSSGHTWHHSDQLLVDIILNGSNFAESQMEPFAGVLTEEEVVSILDYFKSTWGPLERDVQWGATVRDAAVNSS